MGGLGRRLGLDPQLGFGVIRARRTRHELWLGQCLIHPDGLGLGLGFVHRLGVGLRFIDRARAPPGLR